MTIVARLGMARVVPVAGVQSADAARRLAAALLAGGVSCVEITFRTGAAADAIRAARDVEGMLVGAGTVLTEGQARVAAQAGAQFAVAPGLNERVAAVCADLGLPFFPGVATPTEIDRACALGHRTLKVFPAAALGGPAFLRAVSAVYPDVGFIPTGGIEARDLADYLAVPAVLAVGGSWLAKPDLASEEITRRARAAVEASR
jgi:2-dehydro-3-deoxyphosphogluconate aldolase / (4S)-4-hydroxy-2-oxoglutarate aldolase